MRKFKKKLVRLQHRDLDDAALEGIWLGMVDGHYWLTAAKTVTPSTSTHIDGDVYVPADKIVFVQTLAVDSSK